MAGWDEGNVFYSDQQVDANDEQERGLRSQIEIQRQLKHFVKNFEDRGSHKYRESLKLNNRELRVELDDIGAFDAGLQDLLRKNPAAILPLFETAAAEVLSELKAKPPLEERELEESGPRTDVQVMIHDGGHPTRIRDLSASDISKLVKVPGIVIAASRTKAKATEMTLICKNCKTTRVVPCKAGLGGAVMPRSCDHNPQVGEQACPLDPFMVVPDKSKYVDQQTLKLQENPEDVPVGELPRNVLLAVDRHMVQKIVPGTRVTVVGIYSIFHSKESKSRGAVAIRQPYLRVLCLDTASENARGDAVFTNDEVLDFKNFGRQPDAYEKICKMISPSIFGHEDVKRAVACLLFGGARKRLPDGVRLRGDINVLLLGDPSTAKSQFLKFVDKTAPVAVYTSGKGSSAAGLTASVVRDSGSREFYLEGGAMVLADGGVVCIDEFDKMRPEDRVAIHEAMEQQTISIAKAGITTVLNSRTSVLAAANPPSGRYDDLKTAQENIDLQTTILSRFDLIFIVKDIRNHDRDMMIARHVVNVHATAGTITKDTGAQEDENWLKKYIQYCRTESSPRLGEDAASHLQDNYVKIRQEMKEQSTKTGEPITIPITVRQLEAIVRISESLARMEQSPYATVQHVDEALRLFHVSTLDAARSGMTDNIVVTPEQRAEIQQIESHVTRRIGIGSFMSERRLIDEIVKLGFTDSQVRRALLVLCQRGEFEYKMQRRVIARKS